MIEIDKKSDLYLFWKNRINNNAPLAIDNQIKYDICKDYNKIEPYKLRLKYPYKPFLVLAILEEFGIDSFKKIIYIEKSNIVKRFYDFCSFDEYLFKILLSQKAKNQWGLGFNNYLKQSVLAIMKEGPLNHLQTNNDKDKKWFIYDNSSKTIFLDIDSKNIENDVESLKVLCHHTVLKCLPWFEYEGLEYLISTGEILKNFEFTIGEKTFSSTHRRERQHLFRKDVLDRDQKCLICCIENYNILQACHIKPYANCDDSEKYDDDNGITLCLNHHKLFDRGLFTLNQEAKVEISRNLLEKDIHLFFKQYEPCHNATINKFDSTTFKNKFWEYHNKNIFCK